MGEKLYEPFLIGMKINPDINVDYLQKDIREVLGENEFEILPPSVTSPIRVPIETIGLKDGVEFKINFETQSFNIEGDQPQKVINIARNVPQFLENTQFTVKDTIIFYEMHANITTSTGANPREIIDNSCEIDLNNLSDLETYVTGIKINSVGKSSPKLMNMVIQPKAGNPTNFYYLNCLYRSDELTDLIDFANALPQKIEDLLNSLEEGN